MTISLVLMDFILDLEYFSPSFMLDQFKFSIYINGIVVQSSQIAACVLSCLAVLSGYWLGIALSNSVPQPWLGAFIYSEPFKWAYS